MKTCWFCLKEVTGKYENHHRLPKRYHPRGTDHRKGNIVPVCPACHRRFHCELDDPRWSKARFIETFAPINFGEGVFAD